MTAADTEATALQRAHAAAYKLAQDAHMDGCQIPPEVVYGHALQSLVLADVLQKELSRAAFAVVGTCSALRDLAESHCAAIHAELDANSRTTVEALRGIEDALRQHQHKPSKGTPCRRGT